MQIDNKQISRYSLIPAAMYTATPPSTSTITTLNDLSSSGLNLIIAGQPLKYVVSGGTFYGICTAITSSLITIAGPPLSANVTALYVGPPEWSMNISFFVGGRFADAADSTLLANDVKTFFTWDQPNAYLVRFRVRAGTVDTGANQPRVNLTTSSNPSPEVSTSNTNAGPAIVASAWASTVVDISTSNYIVTNGSPLEIKVDNNGSNKDAENLTVQATLVFDR